MVSVGMQGAIPSIVMTIVEKRRLERSTEIEKNFDKRVSFLLT
jgi:hypothetical protein